MDVDCLDRQAPETILAGINAALPRGFRLTAVREISRSVPALSEAISAARYRVEVPDGPQTLREQVDNLMNRSDILVRRERGGRETVLDLHRELLGIVPGETGGLQFTLAVNRAGASLRPEELLKELFRSVHQVRLTREELLVEAGGKRVNPMLAALVAGHEKRTVC